MYHSINIVPYKKDDDIVHAKYALIDNTATWNVGSAEFTATNLNTWDHYHLVAAERPSISPPETKTKYVDIPGIDGPLDLTEVIAGIPLYKNREGSWTFTVVNWFESWDGIYHKLLNELHSKKVLLMLEDDPFFYYKGRLFIDNWKSGKMNSEVSIKYTLEPYKYEFFTSNEPWRWDPFNFNTGIIRNYGAPTALTESVPGGEPITYIAPLTINGTGDNSLTLRIAPTHRIYPVIVYVISGDIDLRIGNGDQVYHLHENYNNITEEYAEHIQDPLQQYIGEDGRTLNFSGYGSLYVIFQGGML